MKHLEVPQKITCEKNKPRKRKICKKIRKREKKKTNSKSIKESIPGNNTKNLIVVVGVSNLDLTVTRFFMSIMVVRVDPTKIDLKLKHYYFLLKTLDYRH